MTDLTQMTDEELAAHVRHLYGRWMYYEAAERGYDHAAASAASREHSQAKAELELRMCRKQAEPLLQVIDTLVGNSKP